MSYNAELYMHELDKKAFAALNRFPMFVKLQESYMENVSEKAEKIRLLSTAIRLNENQMPEVYNLLPLICEKLGIDKMPDLYMIKSNNKQDVNAYTYGVTEPYICLTSELIKQCSSNMIASAIAHECGHIACKHCLYSSIARNFLQGIEASPLTKIPGVKKYISKTLVTAMLFWDRCSELSADRAALLCDGSSYETVKMLLKVNGFDENINVEEFMKQAIDLKDFINDSTSNKLMHEAMVQWNSHPLLATRVYEIHDWENSDCYRGIIDGTLTVDKMDDLEETEIINAGVSIETKETYDEIPQELQDNLEKRLNQLNQELERCTSYAKREDYAYAVAIGIVCGALDSFLFSDTTIVNNDISLSHKQVNNFIQEYAKTKGIEKERLKECISELEEKFKVVQDNVWKGEEIGVSAKNHHLADLAHHPTPLGLVSSIVAQFLRVGTFVNKNGELHFVFIKTSKEELLEIIIPAFLTGFLNWLVMIAKNKIEDETDIKMPKTISQLAHTISLSPILIELINCADNWFGHLVSDMGGSKNTAGGGMGIPGVFMSLLHELCLIPGINNTCLPQIVNDLYVKQKIDLRHELTYADNIKIQAIPVILNEVFIRIGYMLLNLSRELSTKEDITEVNWNLIIPFNNRTVDRMVAVSTMTFNMVDTGDAALRAAIESGGNFVLFSGRFVARYNYVGAGRAALAIVKEVSDEVKETQLIHEKMLLMGVKAEIFMIQLQKFKEQLEEKVSNYLAEGIEEFIEGFDYINEGLSSNNSDLVIKGNVVIQKVLGREPQFTTQEEFDGLMNSEIPFEF